MKQNRKKEEMAENDDGKELPETEQRVTVRGD